MAKSITLFIFWLVLFSVSISFAQSTQPLVQLNDLKYLGAFKIPDNWADVKDDNLTFRYAKGPLAFNPQSTANPSEPSLFMSCMAGRDATNVGEVSIPTPVISTTANLDDLPFATIIQTCQEAQLGATTQERFWQGGIGGLLLSGTTLYFTIYNQYPSGGCPPSSHWVKNSLALGTPNTDGGFVVSNTAGGNCFINGPMTWIPSEWQPLLGNNPAITYNCATSIISSTSWGPSAFSFDPAEISSGSASSVALQYYTSDHATLGEWNGKGGPLVFESPWDNCWQNAMVPGFRGLVLPPGTRSALYFHAQGVGTFCYGDPHQCSGCAICNCDDPVGGCAKGDHAYPYRWHIMAFDLNDWAAVAAGTKQPWEVTPYDVWPFTSDFVPWANGISNVPNGGTTYDPVTRRIYWEHPRAQQNGLPIIHVFEVTTASSARLGKSGYVYEDRIEVWPNPFSTSINIQVLNSQFPKFRNFRMNFEIYDINGRLVEHAFQFGDLGNPGFGNSITWDASNQPAGMYIIRVRMGDRTMTRRVTLMR
jgi:hypothetical protein